MDLENAISSLLSNISSQKQDSNKLGDVIGLIAKAAIGDAKSSSSSQTDINKVFEQLESIASSGREEIFRKLLEAEKQTRKKNEPTLLMAAVISGKTEVVRGLVAAGADVNVCIKEFFTFDAMYFAVDKEYIDIVKILIDAGANINGDAPLYSPIVKAINKKNLELLEVVLNAGAKIVFETGANSLIHAAGKVNNSEIIRLLLQAGCDVNATNSGGDTALVDACLHGHDAVVNILLAAGADANKTRKDGLSPLIAVFSIPSMTKALSNLGIGEEKTNLHQSMLSIIQLLADSGADLNIRNFLGRTALMLAAENGYLDIAQVLIDKGADVNAIEDFSQVHYVHILLEGMEKTLAERSEHKTALMFAAEKGHTEIVDALLKAGSDFTISDEKNRTTLDIAIQQGHTAIVKLLENAGAQAPKSATLFSETALLGAAKQGNLEILQSALQAGINPNVSELQEGRNPRQKTVLMFASEHGHLETVKILIEAGGDVNLCDRPGKKLGKTPLMYAAESGHAVIVRYLLEAGAVVDAQDKRGRTALWYAVGEQNADAVRILLEFAADPHKKSWDDTPFEHATYAGKEIANLITSLDKYKGNTASNAAREEMLRSACFNGDIELVRDLIQQGTNTNAPEKPGDWTALMYAAAKGYIDIVQILLAAGAEVNYVADSKKTALSESTYWGHMEIVNLLISAGAKRK